MASISSTAAGERVHGAGSHVLCRSDHKQANKSFLAVSPIAR